MRRALMAAVLALGILVWPAEAQGTGGRVILDMTVRITPGNQGGCFLLDGPGSLEVTAQSADANFDPMVPPPLLFLGHYRTSPAGVGDPPEIQGLPITPAKTVTTLTTTGSLYCYTLTLSLPLSTPVEVGPEQMAQWRYAALKFTFTPQ